MCETKLTNRKRDRSERDRKNPRFFLRQKRIAVSLELDRHFCLLPIALQQHGQQQNFRMCVCLRLC